MKYFTALFLVFMCTATRLPAQQVLDKLANLTCDCAAKLDTNEEYEKLEAELGLCMLNNASQYKKEVKKELHIDLETINGKNGGKLGELIGTRMAYKCPVLLIKIAALKDKGHTYGSPSSSPKAVIKGSIVEVQTLQFLTVVIVDEKGREQKLLWLDYFDGSDELKTNLTQLKGRSFKITYIEKEFYNPSIRDYMKYKVISGMENY